MAVAVAVVEEEVAAEAVVVEQVAPAEVAGPAVAQAEAAEQVAAACRSGRRASRPQAGSRCQARRSGSRNRPKTGTTRASGFVPPVRNERAAAPPGWSFAQCATRPPPQAAARASGCRR